MPTLTTAQKITAIEASNHRIAYDGCHKIYLLNTEDDLTEAGEYGYTTRPANQIRRTITESCGLVFVQPWSLTEHPWEIEQGTEDIYEAAEATQSKET